MVVTTVDDGVVEWVVGGIDGAKVSGGCGVVCVGYGGGPWGGGDEVEECRWEGCRCVCGVRNACDDDGKTLKAIYRAPPVRRGAAHSALRTVEDIHQALQDSFIVAQIISAFGSSPVTTVRVDIVLRFSELNAAGDGGGGGGSGGVDGSGGGSGCGGGRQ